MNNEIAAHRRTRIDLNQLRHAVMAADYGSFRKAAEALNIKQSTLSRSIKQLEDATSTKLFDRSPGGAIPSHSGDSVIQAARSVLEQVHSLSSLTSLGNSEREKILRIGFCTSLSTGRLRDTIVDFRDKYPQTRIITLERSRSQLATALRNRAIDVIISTGKIGWFRGQHRKLWSERIYVALPQGHRLANYKTIQWVDLAEETLLMSRQDPYWEFEHLAAAKLAQHKLRPSIEYHEVSRSMLKSLISMKLGVGLMLESDIGIAIPSMAYRELRDGSDPALVSFSAFWDDGNENPALSAFNGVLKRHHATFSKDASTIAL